MEDKEVKTKNHRGRINTTVSYVHSTTKASVTINDEDNLYNFHTYLINCRQYKNIYTEFKFEGIANRRLRIDIENKSESTLSNIRQCAFPFSRQYTTFLINYN